ITGWCVTSPSSPGPPVTSPHTTSRSYAMPSSTMPDTCEHCPPLCPACNGTGVERGLYAGEDTPDCSACGGTGLTASPAFTPGRTSNPGGEAERGLGSGL